MVANNSYDQLNYNSFAFRAASIDNIHLTSSLYGLNPPDLENARVLEIGCSMGGNIFPSAIHYPNARFVGVDLSHSQINKGNLILEYMGMKNVTLIQKDVADITQEFGVFDYIICHGVYSWVPDSVKDAILALCKSNLSENGIAYISYNVYPGWKIKDIVRDFMWFSTDDGLPLGDRLDASLKNLDDVVDLLYFKDNQIVKDAFSDPKTRKPHYIAHEQFSEINDPIYFYEFNQRINNHGLSFIIESDFHSIITNSYLDKLIDKWNLDKNKDVIKIEQLHDFLRNRPFRQSLITHTKNGLNVDYSTTYSYSFLNKMKLAAKFDVLKSEGDKDKVCYKNDIINIEDNADNKLFLELNELYPNYLNVGDFFAKNADEFDDEMRSKYYNQLSKLVLLSKPNMSFNKVKHTLSIDEDSKIKIQPEYLGLAQYMIKTKDYDSIVFSNFQCDNITPDFLIDKYLIVKMDGSLTQAELADYLLDFIQSNDQGISFSKNNQKITDVAELASVSKQHVDMLVNMLNRRFLLV